MHHPIKVEGSLTFCQRRAELGRLIVRWLALCELDEAKSHFFSPAENLSAISTFRMPHQGSNLEQRLRTRET